MDFQRWHGRGRICPPSSYPEAQGVSVSIVPDTGARLFDAVGTNRSACHSVGRR